MKKSIRQELKKMIPLNELKERRRKKADKDKKNYHEFYARSTMTDAEWRAIQAKRRKQ